MASNKDFNNYNLKYNQNYIWDMQQWGGVVDNFGEFLKEDDWFKEQWGGTQDKSRAFKDEQGGSRSTNYKNKLDREFENKTPTNYDETHVQNYLNKKHPDFNTAKYSNEDRYNIVNDYMGSSEYRNKDQTISHKRKINDHFNNYSFMSNSSKNMVNINEPGRPEIYNRSSLEKAKEGGSSFLSQAGEMFRKFSDRISRDTPNNVRDMLTLSSIGGQTTLTNLGKAAQFTGMSKFVGGDFTGFNPITNSNINIDYLSNKIGNQNYKPVSDTDSSFKASLKTRYNSLMDVKGERDLNFWKQSQIEETAKSVRRLGSNISPFDNGENTKYLQQQQRVKDSIDRYKYLQRHQKGFDLDPEHKAKLSEEIKTLRGMPNKKTNSDLPQLRSQYQEQLATVEKRIADANNNVKRFFNPIDKNELSSLQSIQKELTERVNRIDMGYGASRIKTNPLEIPKSVSETFEDLHQRRVQLYNQIAAPLGSSIKERGSVVEPFPTRALANINNEIKDTGYYSKFQVTDFSSNLESPEHVKTYKPAYGTTGYGLGLANSFKASRAEHLTRAAHFMNPFGVGGLSATQAIQESFGIMNKAQRQQAAQARGFAKLGGLMVPGIAAVQLGAGIYNNEDAGQIFEDLFSVGTSLAGWRVGAALGGGLGGSGVGLSGVIGRGLGLGIGGLTGMATGFAVGAAVVGGVRDIMKNESEIRKFAKKAYTKEATVSSFTTNQALTARMSSLQKLAKSGLNDRGLLLGNESSVLAGVL